MLPNFQKKLLIFTFFLLSTFYFLSSPALAHAVTPTIAPAKSNITAPPSNTNADVPNNLHNWTQTVMIEVMSSLTCQIAGVDPINPKQPCLGADTKTGKIGFLPKAASPDEASAKAGGAIGFMGNMISTLYTPPLHTADYFRDLASNFGISKKTYAASNGGTGFDSLSPLINIWSAFRNIVYLFLVIVFVIIGLAIMLRVKIDPRTVMTIQNQIPKIIVGILAVTFSFAIAGFLIDMMWVFIYLIYGIISGIPSVPGTPIDVQGLNPIALQGKNVLDAAGALGGVHSLVWDPSVSISNIIVKEFLSGPIGTVLAGLIGGALGLLTASGLGSGAKLAEGGAGLAAAGICAATGVGLVITPFCALAGTAIGKVVSTIVVGGAAAAFSDQLLGIIAGTIAFIIISLALLTALFRLWFTLLIAYVQILLAVVLAPFWIIGGIVPGSPISLGGWLKDISANLLAFPVTIAMFLLGKVFMDIFGNASATAQNFVPPLIGNSGNHSLIGSLIGLGIILMTPNVVTMLKAALKTPKIETGAGKAFGAAAGGPMEMFNKAGSFGFTLSGLSSVPLINKLPILNKMRGGGGHPPAKKD